MNARVSCLPWYRLQDCAEELSLSYAQTTSIHFLSVVQCRYLSVDATSSYAHASCGWVNERELVAGVAIGNDWAFRVVLCKTTHPTFISYEPFFFVVLSACFPLDILSTHCPSLIRCFSSSTVGSIDAPREAVHFLPSHWWTKKDLAPVHLYVHPTPGSDTKRHSDGVPQL